MIGKLQALAEPKRLDILRHLKQGEMTAGQIADRFDVTRPAISHHLGVLEEAGLVSVRRDGTRRRYRLRPEGFAEMRDFIDEFWEVGLARLKRAAERRQRRGGGHGRN